MNGPNIQGSSIEIEKYFFSVHVNDKKSTKITHNDLMPASALGLNKDY
jgi:hypothetical protein